MISTTTIIILTGSCSSGKSTLATHISNLLKNSVVVRCDDVGVQVFNRIVKENQYEIKKEQPRDLLSLLYKNVPEIEGNVLDVQSDKEMYKQIRMHADQGKSVINDNAWLSQKSVEDCNLELQGYRIFRVFVHCCLDDLLTRVKQRNLKEDEIEHRSITLPFRVLPLMYRPQNSQEDQIVDHWNISKIQAFMNKLKNEFELSKHTYNQYWLEDDHEFFSSLDHFFTEFKLNAHSEVSIAPKFPCDFIVNTSSNTTAECAQQIINQLSLSFA